MKKRIEYLDQLRVIAILNVILLHCMAIFRYKYFVNDSLSFFVMTFLNAFTRFGIPIFFMLTGILMFSKKEEESYKEFFFKRVWKLILAYLFFSLIYFLGNGNINLLEFARQVTSFRTKYHLWFMPVIILIYLLIPFLKKFVEALSKEELIKMITIIFILGNGFVGLNEISAVFGYPILSSFTLPHLMIYMNYCFLGYYLFKNDCKVTWKLILLAILSLIFMPICTSFISKRVIIDTFMDAISPLVIAPSILVFLFFKNHTVKMPAWFTNQSKNVFYVYLIHVLPLTILTKKLTSWIEAKGFGKDLLLCIGLWIVVSIISFLFAFLWVKGKEWIKKYGEKIGEVGITILRVMLGILMIGAILCIAINPYHVIKNNIFLTIILMIIIIGLGLLLYKYQDKLWKNKQDMIAMSLVFLGIQILVAYLFAVKPSWDFGRIFQNAIEFAKSAHPSFGNEYLYVCSNNIIISVFFDCVFKLFTWIGFKKYLLLGIAINLFAIDISLCYLYKLLKEINSKYSKPFIVFCILFSPLLFYLPIFYTDTLTIPFIIIPLYYLYKYFFINPKVRYIMVSGSLMAIGGMIKPTVFIPTIAVFIFLLLRKQENRFRFICILLGIISVLFVGKKIFINHFFDQEALELYQMPTSHFIWIGLQGNGGYSEESYKAINQVLGQEERNKLAIQGIKTRMKELWEKKQILSFYFKKFNYTWTDGTFYAGEKLRREPIHKEMTKYINSNESEDWLYWSFSNGGWVLVLVGMFLGILYRKHLPKELQDFQIILLTSTFGIFLFLLIWETRSRYLVNFVPIFLLNAYLGICAIKNKMDRRIKK